MKNNKKDMTEKNKKSKKVEIKKTENKKVKSKKFENKNKINIERCLRLSTYILVILIISLVSFFGIYVKDKNTTINKVKDYSLGSDLGKYRNIIIKVDDSTTSEETEGTEETEDAETSEETPVNEESLLTAENYDKVRKIVEDRIKYMGVDYYEIKYNQYDGTINIIVPEEKVADYIAQYVSTKGDFKISDNDTGEVLLNNDNIKEAKVAYYTTTSGTTVYLNIEFDKNGKEKLKEISNIYRKVEESSEESEEESEDTENEEESEETTKQVTVALDDTTIVTTTFEEEITDGAIQLTLGTSSESSEITDYIEQATNIAVFLNTDVMPIKYKLDTNELIYSNITKDTMIVIIMILVISYIIIFMKSIVKYKGKGILGLIASIGLIAILLLTIRYANVELTLSGIFAIYGIAILEFIFLSNMINISEKDLNKEQKEKEMKNTLKNELESLVPIAIIAVVFSLTNWKPITSIGMVLFWGILEMIIFNFININNICKKEGK